MKIDSENFVIIHGWMRTELNLKNNSLLVYAIIYAFTQTDEGRFKGGLQYIADWCGATKNGAPLRRRRSKHLRPCGL